jgi:effector-binding domain-containing protein
LLDVDAQATAVIRLTVLRNKIAEVMGPAVEEILMTLAAHGIRPTGPCFSFHFARPTDVFDFEVGFPVDRSIAASGRVIPSTLPAGRAARVLYAGGYEGLAGAWASLFARIETAGLVPQPGLWESYVVGPASGMSPENWRTELNVPLAG